MIARFSPSPTGIMHLGNTRTALVSYVLAKKVKGKFILRIEDTDIARSDTAYTENILDTLKWLGVEHDGEIEYQMNNHAKGKYEDIARILVSSGYAYYCNCSVTTLKQMRANQIANKLRIGYTGSCRDTGNTSGVLRLDIKAVTERFFTGARIGYTDLVLGYRHEDYRNIPDPVLMRADGTPTYLMANTSDDASAGVDLITRGSDLLPQTPIQVLLYLALVGEQAVYAHLPLMYNEFGNKLSKRSPDTKGILQYKAEGYLPEAIIQFALSLGNSSIPTDVPLTFSEMIEMYDISKTNNKATSFVEHKIKFINRLHMRAISDDRLSEILKADYNLTVNPELLSLFKHRCDTMVELAESITFTISVVKNHIDEIKQLAIDNFSADSCKNFREQYLNGVATPPINEVYRLIA